MEQRSSAKKATKSNKFSELLRRPLFKLILLIVLIIGVVLILNGAFKGDKKEKDTLVGYQKLVDSTDNKYTYVDLDGKVKTYEGYQSMDDFYYDNTAVSRTTEEGAIEMAIINKNKKEVVKFGTYTSIIQVIGGKYYKVEKDGKYGVVDYNGKTLIKPEYEYISITTVQEAKELVFECQKENKYYFFNEQGKQFLETDVALHSISYANRLNDEYYTIVYITLDNQRRYFNLSTGEEIFKDMGDLNISYNILKSDGKIAFYDKNLKLKSELDTTGDYASDARVYFRKYIVVEQKNVTSGTREYKYTVYDSNFKKVLEKKNKINPVQDVDGNVYFIVNEDDSVKIINEKKKEVKVEGYSFKDNNISNLQYIVLNPLEDSSSNEIFTFKGKKVKDGVSEYSQKGFGLCVSKYAENGNIEKRLILGNNTEIELAQEDEIYATDTYVTIENNKEGYVSLANKEGKLIIEKAKGTKTFYNDKYIGVKDGDNVQVYSVETGKQTYTYSMANYVNIDETVNVVELKNGYYFLDGKTVLEKQQ